MLHQPIQIQDVAIFFTKKICFTAFSHNIYPGNRIGIIGKNGSGKTTLLKSIQGICVPSEGSLIIPNDINFGYIPQIILEHDTLSGAERFNKMLTKVLTLCPAVLCLDEPTNHLDQSQRKSLMRLLKNYKGTLIIATHDLELLDLCVDTIWHIDQNQICCFSGSYEQYIAECSTKKENLEQKLKQLKSSKKEAHKKLMLEQQKTKKKKIYGKKRYANEPLIIANQRQQNAEYTVGKSINNIITKKAHILEQLQQFKSFDVIAPNFIIGSAYCSPNKELLRIENGACGYNVNGIYNKIIDCINLSVNGGERVLIKGNNASGKSTILKAIMNNSTVIKTGNWQIPDQKYIGYLDQHYNTLILNSTVLNTILQSRLDWNETEARKHLNDFLFRKNDEIHAKVNTLSGGEKARLALAQIADISPKLVILDEITNNLDLETKEHVTQILEAYPGSLLIVSHDEKFLSKININRTYQITNGQLI